MLVLNRHDVVAALSMAECIDAMRSVLGEFARGRYEQFSRFQLRPASGEPLIGLMPVFQATEKPLWCLKAVLVAPSNPQRGLESHQGAILLHDGATGELLALVDATAITALRTAATSAVATQALALRTACRIAILGSGAQARSHIEAMRLILPEAAIVLWSRTSQKAQALATEKSVAWAESAEAAVTGADIVCTLTAAPSPIVEFDWLKPGCHVNAVGASSPTARELGTDIVAAAELFVDSREQALVECGEILLPLSEGRIGPDHAIVELGDVLIGRHPGRSGDHALSVFKSLGMAVEDMAAASCALRNAKERNLGREVWW